jgi:hypothetical protein
MGKKLNKNLLNEELKKFRLLSEYSFYVEQPEKEDEKLLLGSDLEEADENPDDESTTPPADDSNTAQNASPDAGEVPDPNAAPIPDANTGATPPLSPDPSATPDAAAPDMNMGDSGDEVDVDVTELVQGNEEATNAANATNLKTSKLLNKFADLERRVAQMDNLSHKIDDLGKEIAKRNPTPVEKLEMRSMDSFPYNIKLSDYFKETDSNENSEGVKKTPEYILKKDDIDTEFIDSSIKNSFDLPDDYEEEDLF